MNQLADRDVLAGALLDLEHQAGTVLGARWPYRVGVSPDLACLPFRPYHLRPRLPALNGLTLVPVFEGDPGGMLGVEVVSPGGDLVCKSTTPLSEARSFRPCHLPFLPILYSGRGRFGIHAFVTQARRPVHILEARLPVPFARLSPRVAWPVGRMTFAPRPDGEAGSGTGGYMDPGFSRLMASVGSVSLEDHYWTSGWQTANVQILAGLRGDESVLDVGCGVGRLAHGLYGWFGGRYVGVDILPESIAYCRRQYPRFEFHCLPVKSEYYPSGGSVAASELVLPAPDASFDVAILMSVYTHLLPEAFVRMTSEVARVLKPGGRCLATFFVLDEIRENALFRFPPEWSPECRVEKAESPEGRGGLPPRVRARRLRTPRPAPGLVPPGALGRRPNRPRRPGPGPVPQGRPLRPLTRPRGGYGAWITQEPSAWPAV